MFLSACVLRKTMLLRCTVLRVMCSVLGVVVLSGGPAGGWDRKTRLIVANHITSLDHMAVDLIEPCILPSVWDIPNLLRWCLGYADLGAREGRAVLVRQAREFCETSAVPLLAFPEGAMTSGLKGLLKFSTWPFEVSDTVQPVLISVYRPLFGDIAPSVLGGAWWQDVLYFLFVPFTVIKVRWLAPLYRKTGSSAGEPAETIEDFAQRVAGVMAAKAGLVTTSLTSQDAVEEAKRHLQDRLQRSAERASLTLSSPAAARSFPKRRAKASAVQLDDLTMQIKQVFPAVPLLAIREDLDRTQDANVTCERISKGILNDDTYKTSTSDGSWTNSADPNDWRKLFMYRKWTMIETNRSKYLRRMQANLSALESQESLT